MFICHTICLYTSSGATGFGLLFRRRPLAASCPTLSDSVSLVSAACLPALLLKPIRSADLPVCPERSPPRPAQRDRPPQVLKGHTHTLSHTLSGLGLSSTFRPLLSWKCAGFWRGNSQWAEVEPHLITHSLSSSAWMWGCVSLRQHGRLIHTRHWPNRWVQGRRSLEREQRETVAHEREKTNFPYEHHLCLSGKKTAVFIVQVGSKHASVTRVKFIGSVSVHITNFILLLGVCRRSLMLKNASF